jgi:hypothetical protein
MMVLALLYICIGCYGDEKTMLVWYDGDIEDMKRV